MPRSSRSLVALLQAFVAGRRGLRLGSLFGTPAVFAGRRVAIRLHGDGIEVRLAPAGRALAEILLRDRVLASPRGWLRLSPPGDGESVTGYLTVFERAVCDVVLA